MAELAWCPLFRRGGNSVSDALASGRLDHQALVALWRPVADQEAIRYDADDPRPDAQTSPERTFVHGATPIMTEHPIVVGYDYQILVRTHPQQRPWVLPVNRHRLHAGEDKNQVALPQLGAALPLRGDQHRVIAFDAGYRSLTLGRGWPTLRPSGARRHAAHPRAPRPRLVL